jgi:flavin reductase (DIM6/NTAB) family NADH-FMN oxidoreductase RutF/rubredoxin
MDIKTLFKLSSGLYIIGTKDDEKKSQTGFAGCVVNTVVQATSKPVTLTVCINKDNYTNSCIKKTNAFSVSILSEEIKESMIGLFGFSSSKEKDKFSEIPYGLTPSGMPYLKEGVTGFIQCKVISFIDNYTHTIFIAEAQEAENISNETPMTYEYYHRVIKGKAPKNAPTYVEEENHAAASVSGYSYKCSVCGYEYKGSKEEFEKLPADFKCPMCGVGKKLFVAGP